MVAAVTLMCSQFPGASPSPHRASGLEAQSPELACTQDQELFIWVDKLLTSRKNGSHSVTHLVLYFKSTISNIHISYLTGGSKI